MSGDEQMAAVLEYRILSFQDARTMGCPPPDYVQWTDDDIDDYDSGIWLFVNGLASECIGTDGGEPEDQTLRRDWAWVATALNRALHLGADAARGVL